MLLIADPVFVKADTQTKAFDRKCMIFGGFKDVIKP